MPGTLAASGSAPGGFHESLASNETLSLVCMHLLIKTVLELYLEAAVLPKKVLLMPPRLLLLPHSERYVSSRRQSFDFLVSLRRTASSRRASTYQVDTGTSRVYARVDAASRLGQTHGIEGRLASGAVYVIRRRRVSL